jgi:hypothetical protein
MDQLRGAFGLELFDILELDRFAAAAGVGHVGIAELEAGLQQRHLVVDLGPEKEHLRHGRDHHPRAVLFDHLVIGIDLGHVVHGVFHARAAALLDADAQALRAVARHQLGDLRGGRGGDADGLFAGNAEHGWSFCSRIQCPSACRPPIAHQIPALTARTTSESAANPPRTRA